MSGNETLQEFVDRVFEEGGEPGESSLAGRAAAEGSADEPGESKSGAGSANRASNAQKAKQILNPAPLHYAPARRQRTASN